MTELLAQMLRHREFEQHGVTDLSALLAFLHNDRNFLKDMYFLLLTGAFLYLEISALQCGGFCLHRFDICILSPLVILHCRGLHLHRRNESKHHMCLNI